jgi:hypothetical protein
MRKGQRDYIVVLVDLDQRVHALSTLPELQDASEKKTH